MGLFKMYSLKGFEKCLHFCKHHHNLDEGLLPHAINSQHSALARDLLICFPGQQISFALSRASINRIMQCVLLCIWVGLVWCFWGSLMLLNLLLMSLSLVCSCLWLSDSQSFVWIDKTLLIHSHDLVCLQIFSIMSKVVINILQSIQS